MIVTGFGGYKILYPSLNRREEMKRSRYNFYKQYGSYCLAVNGRTGSALLIDTRKYPQINTWAAASGEMPEMKRGWEDATPVLGGEQDSTDQELFELLVQHGFLVPKDMVEENEIKSRHQSHLAGKSVLNVHLNPTLDCNLNCWYCYESHVKDSQMHQETQERVLSYIRKEIRSGVIQGVHISYFGGEPFLMYHQVIRPLNEKLAELCDLYRVGLSYSATTNGYLLTDFCQELQESNSGAAMKWKALQITLDGDEPHHNEIRKLKTDGAVSYHRIMVQMLKVLKTDSVDVHLRINYSNANIQTLFGILEDIPLHLRKRLSVSLHRIWQTQDEKEQIGIGEMYAKLRGQGFNMDVHRFVLGKKEVCYADRDSQILINYDGSVFKCTARDFTKENRLGYLDKNGNVVLDGDRWTNRKSKTVWEVSRCAQCHLIPICLGACSQLQYEREDAEMPPCIIQDKKAELDVFMDQVLLKVLDKQRSLFAERK